jgi:hypothetical protein
MKESETGAEPEIVYHYTSHRAALSILQRRELWLSNILYLNDSKEFWWVYELYSSAQSRYWIPEDTEQRIGDAAKQRDRDVSVCVGCFSAHSDDASQWERYADHGQGVAIGFRLSALRKAAEERGGVASRVFYGAEKCVQGIRAALDAEWVRRNVVGESRAGASDALARLAAFAKEPSFESEREYRVAFYGCDHRVYEFRHTARSLVPYVVLPIQLEYVADVKLGPRSAAESRSAWEVFLAQGNKGAMPDGIRVSRSASGLR